MLIIANGAFKSGSTWLHRILRVLLDYEELPKDYHNTEKWRGASIHPSKLEDFLAKEDYATKNYLSKNHLEDQTSRDLLLAHENVLVFNIARDLRDTITSHYFHLKRANRLPLTFSAYYWLIGRFKGHQIVHYHKNWLIKHPRAYSTTYERLKDDFDNEVKKIGRFLGVELSPDDVQRVREETDIENLRRTWGEKDKDPDQRFFRKGVVGDWRNYFNRTMEWDIKRIEEYGGRGMGLILFGLLRSANKKLSFVTKRP